MPLPAGWKLLPLQGTFTYRDGTPVARGRITFTSDQHVVVDGTIVVPKTIEVRLDSDGTVPAGVQIPTTDDPAMDIIGWAYTVKEHWVGGRTYRVFAPYANSVLDLSTVQPVDIPARLVNTTAPPGPPGPMGDVTPEALAARDAAQSYADLAQTRAQQSLGYAQDSAGHAALAQGYAEDAADSAAEAAALVDPLNGRMDVIEDGQAAGQKVYRTWSELSAITGSAGVGAQVIDDTGTHTDPVVGGTVANTGQYVWNESPAGWRWVRPDALPLKADKSELATKAGRAEVEALGIRRDHIEWSHVFTNDDETECAGGFESKGARWRVFQALLPSTTTVATSDDDDDGVKLLDKLLPAGVVAEQMPPELGAVFAVLSEDGTRIKFLIPDDDAPIYARVTSAVEAEGVAPGSITEESLAEGVIDTLSTPRWAVEERGTSPNREVVLENLTTGARRVLPGDDAHSPAIEGSAVTFTESGERKYQLLTGGPVGPVWPSPRLAFFGDSLTAAAGGISAVGTVLGIPTVNRASSGHASLDIAVRQGGAVLAVTVNGGTIPASGAVEVTVSPATGFSAYVSGWYTGSLAGVPGNLGWNVSTGVWTFTRTSAGAATACPPGTPFVSAWALDAEDDVQCLWMGRNDVGKPSWSNIPALLDACVSRMRPLRKRFVIVSVTNGMTETAGTTNHAAIVAHNAYLASKYGGRYYDLRTDFIQNGLTVAGVTPIPADLAAIAADSPPPSLMYDNVHPTTQGYNVQRQLFANWLTAKGYF